MAESMQREVLRMTLAIAVPLRIAEVRAWTTDRRLATARTCADVIGAHGDDLQFGGKHCADAFNKLALGIACCAFQPGGIKFLDDHYEAQPHA